MPVPALPLYANITVYFGKDEDFAGDVICCFVTNVLVSVGWDRRSVCPQSNYWRPLWTSIVHDPVCLRIIHRDLPIPLPLLLRNTDVRPIHDPVCLFDITLLQVLPAVEPTNASTWLQLLLRMEGSALVVK